MQGEKDSLSTHKRVIHSNIQQTETKNVQEIQGDPEYLVLF